MRYATGIAAALAMVASSAVFAEGAMRYTSVDVNYIDLEIDGGLADVNGDGIELTASYALNDKIFLFGEWQEQSFDFGIDGRALEFGAGLSHGLSDSVDFVGTVSYVDAELDFGGFSADDDGLALGAGIRSRLSNSFEVSAMLNWVDYDEAGSDTGLDLLGRYFFNRTMALTFGAEFRDDVDVLRFGFRSEF